MEQQQQQEQLNQNHMRLPLPVDFITNTTTNISNPNFTPKTTTTTTTTSPDPTTITHRQSHQEMQQSAEQLLPASTRLSPPYSVPNNNDIKNNTASPFSAVNGSGSGSSNGNIHLSPRTLGPLPAYYSPPSYAHAQQNHDPSTLSFPDPPSNELAPLKFNPTLDNTLNSLPSLASLASLAGPPNSSSWTFAPSSATSDTSYSPTPRPRAWPTGNPYSVYYNAPSADSPVRMDIDGISHGTRGPLSPDPMGGRASSVSLDDPDVRMAAEALGDLKAGKTIFPPND